MSGDAARGPRPTIQKAAETAPATPPSSGDGGPVSGTDVTLPALGESVTEGTVTRWLKQVGDQITADEALLEVSTDKVDTEIPSPASGVLLEIQVQEDETVEVGSVLAVVGEPGAAAQPEPEPQPERRARTAAGARTGAEAQPSRSRRPRPEPAAAASGPPPSRVPATGSHSARAVRLSDHSNLGRNRGRCGLRSLPWSASWPRSTASI